MQKKKNLMRLKSSNIKNNKNKTIPIQTFKKGHIFDDGEILKKKYFRNNKLNYIIFLNDENEVKYKGKYFKINNLNEINNLGLVITELNLIPSKLKGDLNLYLAKIYDYAFSGQLDKADKDILLILEKIEARKIILKKFVFLLTPLIIGCALSFIIYTLGYNGLNSIEFLQKYYLVPVFSTIGNFTGIIYDIKRIEFHSHETPVFYIFFAIFKYIASIFSSIMLLLFYNSGIISFKLGTEQTSELILIAIISALGGYSQVLVPNFFDSISKNLQSSLSQDKN